MTTQSGSGILQLLSVFRRYKAQTGHRLLQWSGSTVTRPLRDIQIGLVSAQGEGLTRSAPKCQREQCELFSISSNQPTNQPTQKFVQTEAVTSFPFNVNDPVETQAYDNVNCRLALASHSGVLKMFKLRRSEICIWQFIDSSVLTILQKV